jgi:hypothetical protein
MGRHKYHPRFAQVVPVLSDSADVLHHIERGEHTVSIGGASVLDGRQFFLLHELQLKKVKKVK